MRRALYRAALAELWLALHLGAAGEWWAARAARRLGKFSGNLSAEADQPPDQIARREQRG